jgi:hypothetical protein
MRVPWSAASHLELDRVHGGGVVALPGLDLGEGFEPPLRQLPHRLGRGAVGRGAVGRGRLRRPQLALEPFRKAAPERLQIVGDLRGPGGQAAPDRFYSMSGHARKKAWKPRNSGRGDYEKGATTLIN